MARAHNRLLDFSLDMPIDTDQPMLLKSNDDAMQLEHHAGGIDHAKSRGYGVVNDALKSDWISWLPGLVSFVSSVSPSRPGPEDSVRL